ncbi:MAG: hypothetical protein O2880_04745 [Proteobacteria bacterium]|nr:hypothetical protein [Pseudomonadota bacterium]
MSSLTAIFGNSEVKSQDSDKLMDLYWNRAELKKEFAGMRKEQFRLQDVIKQQEGAKCRLQQKLDHLESLLVDAQLSHNVVVFYQLRGLGHKCERKVAKFAEQLKQQREQKRHSSVLATWNEQRQAEAKDVELQLLEKRDAVLQLEDQLQAEQRRLASMSGLKRLFSGRSAMKLVDGLAGELEVAVQKERMLNEAIDEIKNRQPPDHQGLEIPAKRSINLMIISFAQQLYIHFAEFRIADLIKESTEKSVGAINYGTRYECDELLGRIQKSIESMEQSTQFADVLQKRAKMIGELAKFPGSNDAVPIADTAATLFQFDSNGLVRKSDANLVGENYWGMSKIFSR